MSQGLYSCSLVALCNSILISTRYGLVSWYLDGRLHYIHIVESVDAPFIFLHVAAVSLADATEPHPAGCLDV
ncbi:hypothetical protein F5Y09DRAFT_317211 [Xylaria sp. FL1042]|nr:hypothetical protein F5Y09DRAFT_317211 [Xylaria sp. FL1042]